MKINFHSVCLLLFATIFSTVAFCEGSKQLLPASTDTCALMIDNSTYGNFAVYGSKDEERLYIHIANPSAERVYLGFSRGATNMTNLFGGYINTYFRIKDPNGNVVFGPQLIDGTTANVPTWAKASAGPSPIIGASGYSPFTYTPASGAPSGDYYIEFSTDISAEGNNDVYFAYFDITVATRSAPITAINGRLFSKRWALVCSPMDRAVNPYGYFFRPFHGKFYVLDRTDGIVSAVNFNGSGFQPYAFNISFNSYGTNSTGNPVEDRKSVNAGLSTYPEHLVFVNDPDPTVFPSGTFGTFTQNANLPNIKGCGGVSGYDINFQTTRPGLVEVLLDFNQASGVGVYDPGTADRILALEVVPLPGEQPPYDRIIAWDGKNGLGNTVTATSIKTTFTYSQGLYHLPVFDVEYTLIGIQPSVIRPSAPPSYSLKLFYDDSNIPDAPGNGANKIEASGCTPPCHSWSNFDYGNGNTINTYWFSAQERFNMTLSRLGCPPTADDEEVTTTQNTPIVIDILDGDSDPNGTLNPATVTIVSTTSNGTLSINTTTGAVTYTPNANFTGVDYFTYTVKDDDNETSNVATVRINVIPNVSCAPIRTTLDWATDFDGSGGSGTYNLQNIPLPYSKILDNVTIAFAMQQPSPNGSVLKGFEATSQFSGRPTSFIPNSRSVVWSQDESQNGTDPNHQATTLTITFNQKIKGLQFAIFDLDDGTFDVDGVKVQFYKNGVKQTLPLGSFSMSSRVTNPSTEVYVGEGTEGNAVNTSTEGDIYFTLPNTFEVDEVRIIYGNYRGSSYNAAMTHYIGLSNFSWCRFITNEICNNNFDDDFDGFIDCTDPDCQLSTTSPINNN